GPRLRPRPGTPLHPRPRRPPPRARAGADPPCGGTGRHGGRGFRGPSRGDLRAGPPRHRRPPGLGAPAAAAGRPLPPGPRLLQPERHRERRLPRPGAGRPVDGAVSTRLVVGVTGASGALYAVRFLKACLEGGVAVDLVVSDYGQRLLI